MEEKTAVSAESAPATETQEVVNETAPDQQSQPTQTSQETATPPQGQETYEAVDERGVPYKNSSFEWKRKYEETVERMPNLIDEAIKNSFKQYGQPKEQEYTIAQLEKYAMEQPEYRPWVEEQKAVILRKQLASEVDQRVKAVEIKQKSEILKQQSLNYVVSLYPELFVRNPQGQIMGINQQSPMTSIIDDLMRRPQFSNDPEGLMAAADIAYARVSRLKANDSQLKQQKLQAEVKHLQKQTMVEGGGKQNIQAAPEFRKAIDKAKKSGTISDVAKALAEIAKARRSSTEK